jgi:hypothetical protein
MIDDRSETAGVESTASCRPRKVGDLVKNRATGEVGVVVKFGTRESLCPFSGISYENSLLILCGAALKWSPVPEWDPIFKNEV